MSKTWFTIAHLNIRSLIKHIDELIICLVPRRFRIYVARGFRVGKRLVEFTFKMTARRSAERVNNVL